MATLLCICRVLAAYLDTYQQLLQFETREPSEENIRAAVRLLVERKARHRDTVGQFYSFATPFTFTI